MASPEIGFTLYVKASTRDGKSLGADIVCHRVMMMLALKDIAGISGRIFPVDTVRKSNVDLHFPYKNLPTLVLEIDGKDQDFDDAADIEDRFERSFQPVLRSENKAINSFVSVGPGCTIYHKFNQYIKNKDTAGDPLLREHLLAEIKKVNNFLLSDNMPKDEHGNKGFLCGSKPGLPDCYFLPKMHYIFVTLGVVKEFPEESYPGIEAYLELGRKHPAFSSTCPEKPDIIHFFCRQANLPESVTMKKCAQVEK
ncbi:predicted protein [Nematostella vectensis]|uniref:GST C-terminal domain-containing protein n=1 Tax=Nematostella vectensis TaxID=45351 RepID=A7SWL2_NEMVE|nr:maleylacetoacetate isomerase [Nematostella vectensis]EDO31904.1 predicted protein [Nematostella vectensis]|eukprot:XP_001624004.1 predicted protein [Nematostella vectensis]